MQLRPTHLDAMRGDQEERVSRTGGTVKERETPVDKAVRQEPSVQSPVAAGRTAMRRPWW